MTAGTPPTRSTSFMTNWPNGLRSPRWGTLSAMREKSARVRSTSASFAMARRWSTALVEPPNAITTAIAFSKAGLVMMSRAVMPWRSSSTTASPDLCAYMSRRRSVAGGAAEPGRDMPRASPTDAMVLAVNIPPHAPSPGQMARSIRSTSSWDMSPRAHAPTASNASMIVTSFSVPSVSVTCPGMIEPAYRNTDARSRRAAAISIPGRDLSQPASVTEPSRRSACMTVSTESAIRSRDTSEKCMPSWPMEMPSDTEMVPNSSG